MASSHFKTECLPMRSTLRSTRLARRMTACCSGRPLKYPLTTWVAPGICTGDVVFVDINVGLTDDILMISEQSASFVDSIDLLLPVERACTEVYSCGLLKSRHSFWRPSPHTRANISGQIFLESRSADVGIWACNYPSSLLFHYPSSLLFPDHVILFRAVF